MKEAACRGEFPTGHQSNDDTFFPGKGRWDLFKKARMMCSTCPVQRECHEYQKKTGSTDGVWGKPDENQEQA